MPDKTGSEPSPLERLVAARETERKLSVKRIRGYWRRWRSSRWSSSADHAAAQAHGPYTAAQVRSAFETTRQLLIAANLDWPTLRDGNPKAFEKLLVGPELKDFLAGLHTTALFKDRGQKNTRKWIIMFAPGSTKFVTMIVKVHGTMKAGVTTVSGSPVLRITVDYLRAVVRHRQLDRGGAMRHPRRVHPS